MIELDWPWMLLVLPLPWLVRRLWTPAPEGQGAALRVPFFRDVAGLGAGGGRGARRRGVLGVMALAWVLLVLAAARPQWVGPAVAVPTAGRDLMLAVDLSGSMENADLTLEGRPVDRLSVVKAVAGDFIARREGDRVGLILFGTRAYLQAPLTFDRTTVRTLLDESEIALAGEKTALGDALGLGVKVLRDRPAESRVLVLLTDGVHNAGALAPEQAAALAAESGVTVYTIGVGADRMVVRTPLGPRRVNPAEELDEATLDAIAEATGGRYFRARDTAGLAEIYARIDALEPTEGDPGQVRPTVSLFHWPLAAALLLTTGLALVRLGWPRSAWRRRGGEVTP